MYFGASVAVCITGQPARAWCILGILETSLLQESRSEQRTEVVETPALPFIRFVTLGRFSR